LPDSRVKKNIAAERIGQYGCLLNPEAGRADFKESNKMANSALRFGEKQGADSPACQLEPGHHEK